MTGATSTRGARRSATAGTSRGSRGGRSAQGGASRPAMPYRAAARQLLRDTLLDAARRLLEDRPWAQITMSDVARGAGLSRQTLYKELGTREEFAQQFVIREGARFLEVVEGAILAHLDDPVEAVAAGLEVFLTVASEDPLVRMLLEDDGTGGMLPLITTQSRPVLEWASDRLFQIMRSGWPVLDAVAARLLADSLVRLALSYVTMPRRSPRESASATATLLAPYLRRAMAGA
ncbi:MAG TPA: TetR family transcriptional regulator [Solirubrobacteraceae bacterium]|jgi:AcrR family transcriptional regulator|nr:TetR family transcriptional regulator [Solirubrobacteraceae bacterium]